MLNRETVKTLVEQMPDNFSVDDLVEEIVILQRIEFARQQVKEGKFLTEDELDKEISSWD